MDNGCQKEDYIIKIGIATCTASILARNVLTCNPPLKEPQYDRATSRQGAMLVDVCIIL